MEIERRSFMQAAIAAGIIFVEGHAVAHAATDGDTGEARIYMPCGRKAVFGVGPKLPDDGSHDFWLLLGHQNIPDGFLFYDGVTWNFV